MTEAPRPKRPAAIILGGLGIEIVRALTLAGIPCGLVARPGDPGRWSRYTTSTFDWNWFGPMAMHDASLADRLVRHARRLGAPPVLFCCSDEPMLFVSRFRRELAEAFRFVISDRGLVEALVDKARFSVLAAQLGLPVPATLVIEPGAEPAPRDIATLGFPFILKPKKLDRTWLPIDPLRAKAMRVDSLDEWRALWPRLAALGAPIIAQQYVEGPESRVESYHVYVAEDGEIVAEFTGRKIRTLPAQRGDSTALTLTDDPALRELGRRLVRRLDLRGVAKLDFKRAPDGRLYLLEVNARLTLWNHLAARAGVNIPALVYADLTGRPRPRVETRPAPATWCHPKDVVAARREGVPFPQWLAWAARSDAKAFWSWRDPLPLMGLIGTRALNALRDSMRPAGPR
jgi:D-aspartate ligase